MALNPEQIKHANEVIDSNRSLFAVGLGLVTGAFLLYSTHAWVLLLLTTLLAGLLAKDSKNGALYGSSSNVGLLILSLVYLLLTGQLDQAITAYATTFNLKGLEILFLVLFVIFILVVGGLGGLLGFLIHKTKKVVFSQYRGWTAFVVSIILGLLLGYYTHIWQLLFIPAIVAGYFGKTYKKGAKYGSLSILVVYAVFLLYYIVTASALEVLTVFVGVIGIQGMGILGVLIILLIGYLVGLTGGYLGSVIHSYIQLPSWS